MNSPKPDQPTHEHYWLYESTQLDDKEALWPVQHWYRCQVCNAEKGMAPLYGRPH